MKGKNLKSLVQTKQKLIAREEGYPSKHSGRDGDFQVRRLKFYLVNTLLKYKTKDGYRGYIVKVREEK